MLEDWIWASAPDEDRAHRAKVLAQRAEGQFALPSLDDNGLLRFRSRETSLSPTEAVLVAEFVTNFDQLVKRTTLTRAVWPDGAPRPRTLDTHILRLRRRVAEASLEIETVRARGWVMRAMSREPTRQLVDV